jgi:type II secretory pathway predicted ATPase ExeA
MGSGRRASEVFAGLEILEDLEMISARLRSPYAGILPRNHFILKKRGPPAPLNMTLAATQDSNRTLLKAIIKTEGIMNISTGNKKSDFESETMSPSRLYLDFYTLRESPFSITPDPDFLYMSSSHRAVIEKILYGIRARMGFLLLIGEVGAGKTTLCRTILDELTGKAETVYIINPSLSGMDLIQSIMDDLGLKYPANASKKGLLDQLNSFLLTRSKDIPVVIIIDDAQTMTVEGLETLRLLSNLETDKEKLIQLVLVGQQELLDTLSKPEMRQVQQRITIRCGLGLLDKTEIQGYVSHRLFVAGDKGNIQFSPGAIKKIFSASRGIPRLINNICDYALTASYVSNSLTIDVTHIKQALSELEIAVQDGRNRFDNIFLASLRSRIWPRLAMTAACLFLLLVGYFIFNNLEYAGGPASSQAKDISQSPSPVQNIKDPPAQIALKEAFNGSQKASPTLTGNEASKPATIAEPSGGHSGFILQVASYKTPEDAEKAVSEYAKQGVDVHWNAVESGDQIMYRVYAGRFPTKEAAEELKTAKGLADGVVFYAPWTIQMAASRDKAGLLERCSEFREMGFDCTLEGDEHSGYRIAGGAFKISASATNAANELIKKGIDAKVVFE